MIRSLLGSGLRRMNLSSGKGIELKRVVNFLEDFAPTACAETWDNTGLLVEPFTPTLVENVLLTNDLTEEVLSEALDLRVGLIISYHPPIFRPLKRITTEHWKERVVGTCLENRIAIYSPHTSWDCVPGGITDWLASAFDHEGTQPIVKSCETKVNFGAGRYCKLKRAVTISEAIDSVKNLTGLAYLNVALAKGATLDTTIRDVAVCCGSGSSVLNKAKADLYLTGELSHHDILDAIHNGTTILLCNHSNSERGFLKQIGSTLSKEFGEDLKVFLSKKDKDPLQCDTCSVLFKHQGSLYKHLEVVHKVTNIGANNIKCGAGQSNESFNKLAELMNHVN